MNALIYALGFFSFVENIGTIQAVLFVVGIILLFAEMFSPGLGVAAAVGTVSVIAGIVMTARTPLEAFVMSVILLLLITLVLIVILRSAKKGKLSKSLILRSAMKKEEGYSSASDNTALIGKEGVALSQLRPSGIGEFDGQRLDVVSEGTYIEPGTRITVVHTEGRRIVVKPIH
ncbi:MAG: NfeD family protein [Eubacteriales bacterium]